MQRNIKHQCLDLYLYLMLSGFLLLKSHLSFHPCFSVSRHSPPVSFMITWVFPPVTLLSPLERRRGEEASLQNSERMVLLGKMILPRLLSRLPVHHHHLDPPFLRNALGVCTESLSYSNARHFAALSLTPRLATSYLSQTRGYKYKRSFLSDQEGKHGLLVYRYSSQIRFENSFDFMTHCWLIFNFRGK